MDFSHLVTLMVVRQFDTLMKFNILINSWICDSTSDSPGLLHIGFLYGIFMDTGFWMPFDTFFCQQDY
jgi:hypothetical protein